MNSTFRWARGLSYGVVIWLVMFAFISMLVGFEADAGVWAQAATIGVSALMGYVLSFATDPRDALQAFEYGILWVGIGIVLDLIISYQFNNAIFSMWQYWVGHALLLVAPWLRMLLQPTTRHRLSTI